MNIHWFIGGLKKTFCPTVKRKDRSHRLSSFGAWKIAGEFRGYSEVMSSMEDKKWTPSQVALSWLISRSEAVFPIPRASISNHVQLDAQAADLQLTNRIRSRTLERCHPT